MRLPPEARHHYADSEKRLPVGRRLETTKGSPIDHVAFSFEHIEPVFDRMRAAGLTIVEPIAMRAAAGLKSFFVHGPDNVLVEIVEAKPIPEGLWQ
jgi:catechol 2,3-dioxygenase-like lactoylglutathione lyase family enzyme